MSWRFLLRIEGQGDAVHTVPHTCRVRAIREHMTEVPAAARAVHFDTRHAQGGICRRLDTVLERLEEARPPRAAFKFRVRRKQRLAAGATLESPGPFLTIERARSRGFRAVLSKHFVLLGRQRFAPF